MEFGCSDQSAQQGYTIERHWEKTLPANDTQTAISPADTEEIPAVKQPCVFVQNYLHPLFSEGFQCLPKENQKKLV